MALIAIRSMAHSFYHVSIFNRWIGVRFILRYKKRHKKLFMFDKREQTFFDD